MAPLARRRVRPCPCARAFALAALALVGAALPAAADEGMWLPDRFPFERFEAAHGLRPSAELIDRLRAATLKMRGGGTGAFVSAEGLVLTAQHVVSGCLSALARPGFDPAESGFLAAGRSDERRCPGAEALLLIDIERVGARVRAAAARAESAAAAAQARYAAMAAIEAECAAAAAVRCDVIELDSGAEHDLYRYRRLTDLRLVYAPERRLALFGGDADNFEYPRYWLDFALLRAYDEAGRPFAPAAHLPLARRGPRQGEVLLTAGHPGPTARRSTVAQLEWLRDGVYPLVLQGLAGTRATLATFAPTSVMGAARRERDLFNVDNSIKAISGYLAGLLDPERMAAVRSEEEVLRRAFAAARGSGQADPWREIEAALARAREIHPRLLAVERGLGAAGDLAGWGRALLRLAAERERPSGERLREYRDAALPGLLAELEAERAVDPAYEALRLGQALRVAAHQLGPIHPVVRGLFAERSPEQVAQRAVAGTRLADPAYRRALVAGGRAALVAEDDPLLDLLSRFEPEARALRERWERQVAAVEADAGARLVRLRRELGAGPDYPEGTWTLRLGFGIAAGYSEGGRELPFATRLEGLFERAAAHGGRPPFEPAPRLVAARARLDPLLPIDFASTLDIGMGSSGGPVVTGAGEVVGVVFDGNLWLLPNRFRYSQERARTIAVDSRAIAATLAEIDPAPALLAELFPPGAR